VMGRMRSALRAYALETTDPAEVLARLDRKMQHFEPDAMATVLYAVFDPSLGHVHVASAGHPPPVLAAPGQPSALAAVDLDLMIGIAPHVPRQITTLTVPPGAVLCLYTDGLIERPGELIDHGLTRLRHAVQATAPETVCAAVMAAMIGDEPARDDIALLVIRRTSTPD
jgi:serine phosphatase RsbU (regulator of sigma subunit)